MAKEIYALMQLIVKGASLESNGREREEAQHVAAGGVEIIMKFKQKWGKKREKILRRSTAKHIYTFKIWRCSWGAI